MHVILFCTCLAMSSSSGQMCDEEISRRVIEMNDETWWANEAAKKKAAEKSWREHWFSMDPTKRKEAWANGGQAAWWQRLEARKEDKAQAQLEAAAEKLAKTEAQIAEDQKAAADLTQEMAAEQEQCDQEYEHRRELRSC